MQCGFLGPISQVDGLVFHEGTDFVKVGSGGGVGGWGGGSQTWGMPAGGTV